MASCRLVDTSGAFAGDYQDELTYRYLADLGAVVINPRVALAQAQALGPDPVPTRRANLAGTFLFANSIRGTRTKENREVWEFEVSFTPPPKGEDETQQNANPLLRPPVFGIEYIEQEYVVKQARNVDGLGAQFAAGAPYRTPNTLGPIVNGAIRRPDEPIVRTRRVGVITIELNYADLGEIMDLNEDYQVTCNSDSVTLGTKTFSARRLKYEVTRAGGKQVENDITYYPGVTEIAIHKTTDLVLDNVGFEYYTLTGNLTRAKDADGVDTAEPVNLTLAGLLNTGDPTQITYRDLEEVPYAGFFS